MADNQKRTRRLSPPCRTGEGWAEGAFHVRCVARSEPRQMLSASEATSGSARVASDGTAIVNDSTIVADPLLANRCQQYGFLRGYFYVEVFSG